MDVCCSASIFLPFKKNRWIKRIYFTPFSVSFTRRRRRERQKSSEEESSGQALMNIRAVESARTMEYYDRSEWRREDGLNIFVSVEGFAKDSDISLCECNVPRSDTG